MKKKSKEKTKKKNKASVGKRERLMDLLALMEDKSEQLLYLGSDIDRLAREISQVQVVIAGELELDK